MRAKPSVPLAVMELLLGFLMGWPVQLDDEFGGNANEIGDIRINWHLSPEFPSKTAAA